MMDMTASMIGSTAMDLVVGLAILFALVFLAGWLISPRLRAWVERPKFRFQANVRTYDRGNIKGRNAP
jgi:hypothetical protein